MAQLRSLTSAVAWLPQRPPSLASAALPAAFVPALLSVVGTCGGVHVCRVACGWRAAGPPMACTEEERREAGRKDAVTE
jgi:hypothetical protein